MNEQGQKIFKIAVWIIITIVVICKIVSMLLNSNDSKTITDKEPITRIEWAEMLANSFGDDTIKSNIESENMYATGEYIILTSMNAIGDDRLSYLIGDELTDKKKINYAVKNKMIKKKKLDKKIKQGEAKEILSDVVKLYTDSEYYPEYCNVDSDTYVIDADSLNDFNYDEETQMVNATINGETPQIGDVIMYKDDYGIAHAKFIENFNESNNDNYNMKVKDIDDATDILNSISFSGSADFSYMLGENDDNTSDKNVVKNAFLTKAYASNSIRKK